MVESNNQISHGKLPPQAIDYEEALIGALMLESEAYLNISSIIDSKCFYNPSHSIIYLAVQTLYNKSLPIDLLTVTRSLKDSGDLDKIGGPLALTELVQKVGSAAHSKHYARIIKQKHMQREIITAAWKLQEMAYDDNQDVKNILAYAMNEIERIENNSSNDGQYYKEVVSDTFKELEEDCSKIEKGLSPGIPTPLFDLTKAIGGWKAPYFTVMGARPGVGKTTIAWNFALHAAKNGYWTNYYSYEMLSTGLCKINISAESNVDRTIIRDGKLIGQDWDNIGRIVDDISGLPIIMYDNPDISASQIRANTHKNKLKGECDIVIIDYLQLIPAEDKKTIREQQVSEISKTLKRITTALKVPVIVLAQLNRAVEGRPDPETFKSDLRESGSLEQDADIVLLPYNIMEGDLISQRILKIDKNRSGNVGKIEFSANVQMTKIFDTSSHEEPINYHEGLTPDDTPF